MHSVLHHLHQRQRHSHGEPYPHPRPFVRTLDALVYAVSIIGPATAVPQLLSIWQTHDVENLSLLFWTFGLFASVIWAGYSFVHRVKPLIVTNILRFAINLSIVVGIVRFRT